MELNFYRPSRDVLRESLVTQALYILDCYDFGIERSEIERNCADWNGWVIEDTDFPLLAQEALKDFQERFPHIFSDKVKDWGEDFSLHFLSGIKAKNARFYRCNFEGLSLFLSEFQGAYLEDCNLQSTFSGGYDLNRVVLIRPQLTLDARIVMLDLGAIDRIEDERFYNFRGDRLHGVHFNDLREVVYTPTLKSVWKNCREHGCSAKADYRDFQETTGLLARALGQKSSLLQNIKCYLLD